MSDSGRGLHFGGIVAGFVAGVIAMVTGHELATWLLRELGLAVRIPWSAESAPAFGGAVFVPQVVSDMVWGGLSGAIFAVLAGSRPQGRLTGIGALYGLAGPGVIGALVLVPLLSGRYPLFLGGDGQLILASLFALASYGAVLGWVYGLIVYRRLP